jgi:hypothetical protein
MLLARSGAHLSPSTQGDGAGGSLKFRSSRPAWETCETLCLRERDRERANRNCWEGLASRYSFEPLHMAQL